MSSANPIKRNLPANILGQIWVAVMNVLFIPVYLSHLGIEAYGLVGALGVVVAAGAILDAGMAPTLNREMARFGAGYHSTEAIRDLVRTIESVCWLVILSTAIAGLLVSHWLSRHWLGASNLPPDLVDRAVFMMILLASFRIGEGVYRGALMGLQSHVWVNSVAAALSTLRAGGAALLVTYVSQRVDVFFAWQVVVSVLSVAILAGSVHLSLPPAPRRPHFSMAVISEIKGFAGGVFAATILSVLLTQSDKIILVRMLPLSKFGYYVLAATLANGLYQVVTPIAQSYYPRLTELLIKKDMRLLSGTYHQGAQLLTMALAPFAILLVFFSKDVLLLWTGDPTVAEQAAPILRLLAAGTLLHGLMHIPYMLQLAAGWSSLSVRVNLAFAAILVPSIIVAVPHFGAIGAAAIWCLLNVGYILVSIQIMHRRLLPAERLRWYTEDTARPILVLMGAALLFSIVDPHTHHAVLSAMFLGIAGISLAILAVLSAPLARETLIRQLRSFNSAKAGTQSRTLE